ncbi:T9SS type A sorting domain-containing protein [Flavobacterium sp.]|uniref:RCC1 domain-containing protein n=1 Tax=Flavobacterium sp. TaxID=239 RepID=UPI00375152FD
MKNIKLTLLLFLLFSIKIEAQCWSKINCGSSHTVAIRLDGSLWGWGDNSVGQIGSINCINNQCLNQTIIENVNLYLDINSGSGHTILLKNDNTLWSLGGNSFGKLGLGLIETSNVNAPTQIGTSNDWNTISSTSTHVLGLKLNGTLWAWGNNTYGQLGDGSTMNKNIPVQIGFDTNWQKIRSGYSHSLAIKNDGTLWVWGRNNSGQLGDNSLIDKNFPIQIGSSNDWVNVYAGYEFSIALKNDGSIWSWGNNQVGQLGDGTFINKQVPTQIGSNNDWQSLDSDYGHTLAIKNDGSLWSWGWNNGYRLGDGSTINRNSPIQIGNSLSWAKISAGAGYSMAITNDNLLYVWGINNVGQLGDGTNSIIQIPTQLLCAPLSLNEFNKPKITIYPNPTKDILNITSTTALQKTIIYNLLGAKVYEQLYNETIDVSSLSIGMYILQVFSEDGVFNSKFVKE